MSFTLFDFDMAYDRLAAEGKADSPGGGEYERVRLEWFAADCPPPEEFIYRRANIASDGSEPIRG